MTKQLLHFTADWCNPCKKIKPIIEEYVLENSDVEYVVVDVDNNFQMAKEYNVLSVPTIVVMIDGLVFKRHSGILTKDILADLFK
jgi:thioredoxin 1